MTDSVDSHDPFPESYCVECFSELSLWTAIEDILVAARYIENRPHPTDDLDNSLFVPFPGDDTFQGVLINLFKWLIDGFRVPNAKLRFAQMLDPKISEATIETLSAIRFRPTIKVGRVGQDENLAPGPSNPNAERFLHIADDPVVIEIVQNPIRCLLDMITRIWEVAQQLRKLSKLAEETGSNRSPFFHQPYADGPLYALVEAVIFYVHGVDLGPRRHEGEGSLNLSYRSVEVVARPPVNAVLMKLAQQTTETIFNDLR